MIIGSWHSWAFFSTTTIGFACKGYRPIQLTLSGLCVQHCSVSLVLQNHPGCTCNAWCWILLVRQWKPIPNTAVYIHCTHSGRLSVTHLFFHAFRVPQIFFFFKAAINTRNQSLASTCNEHLVCFVGLRLVDNLDNMAPILPVFKLAKKTLLQLSLQSILCKCKSGHTASNMYTPWLLSTISEQRNLFKAWI